jgi:hypothetical protein
MEKTPTTELVKKIRIVDGFREFYCTENSIPEQYVVVVLLLNAARDGNGEASIGRVGYSYRTYRNNDVLRENYSLYKTWKTHLQLTCK